MAYGLTTTGFIRKDLNTIKAEIEASLQTAFGLSVDLSPNEPLGQLVGIFAEREALLWEYMEATYFAFYPDTAAGVSLDNLASLTGITREPATYSQATVTFTRTVGGTGDIVIPAGFQVSVSGASDRVFATTAPAVLLNGDNTIDVPVRCTVTGPVVALAGTLTVIVSGLFGIASATNAADALVGSSAETDVDLRFRRLSELQAPGTSAAEGIRTALLALDFVTEAIVVENETDVTDGDGRPPHSFEAIVADDGEVANEPIIAETIWASKPAGIQTFGTITETVTDSQGFTHDVKFSRPGDVEIWVDVTVTPNTDPNEGDLYPADGDDQVIAAILAYGNGLTIGRDVVFSRVYAAVAQVPGVLAITLKTGIVDPPLGTTNITIAFSDIARFDSARITVTS